MSRAVGYMFSYLVMLTFLNSVIYGTIIYATWDTLGIFVDKCTIFDIIFPLPFSIVASACSIIAVWIINGDW